MLLMLAVSSMRSTVVTGWGSAPEGCAGTLWHIRDRHGTPSYIMISLLPNSLPVGPAPQTSIDPGSSSSSDGLLPDNKEKVMTDAML